MVRNTTHLEAPLMGAEEPLGPGSCRLKLGDIRGRGVRVPSMRKPSVTFSMGIRGICSLAGALLEPTSLGVSTTPLPDPAPGLPAMPLPGSSWPASDCGFESAFGVSCFHKKTASVQSSGHAALQSKSGSVHGLLFAM